jgi:hypothetical protein
VALLERVLLDYQSSVVLKHLGLIDLVEGADREKDTRLKKSDDFRAAVEQVRGIRNTTTPHPCLAVSLSLHLLSTFHSDSHDISSSHLSAAPQACGTPNAVASAVCPCCRISH